MGSTVLIYGERLKSADWDKARSRNPAMFDDISFSDSPSIPETASRKATAYLDLENKKLLQPSFIQQLINSFDQLRVIGIGDNLPESRTIEIARMGISEVLTSREYRARIKSFCEPEEEAAEPETKFITGDSYSLSSIIGDTDRIKKIKKMIENLSDVDFPNAIIFGETGVGKDLIAKVMHYNGIRKEKNFIEVNCSAIPDELFESELFGHTKGAFTDARADKKGLFEYANNGTIFLDEIGNLSSSAQAKLLKILESRRLRPLGAVEEKDINVRVLAATNIDLHEAVKSGRFREDLLFRLNLIAIHLPPLRERREDIPALARYCLDYYRSLYSKNDIILKDEAVDVLCRHAWPGNVRELRNVIERSVLLVTGNTIGSRDIRDAIANGRVSVRERKKIIVEIPEGGISLKDIEKKIVGEVLNLVEWNRTEAARMLNISRGRLRRIMEENNLGEDRRHRKRAGSK
jgi:two-component system response regulator AtoC